MATDAPVALATTIPMSAQTQLQTPHCSLSECVQRAISDYLSLLGDQRPVGLHKMVISEVERPLLEQIMAHNRGNQSRTANELGISRGTLRKKLEEYGIE